jgi:hypothetical protein
VERKSGTECDMDDAADNVKAVARATVIKMTDPD